MSADSVGIQNEYVGDTRSIRINWFQGSIILIVSQSAPERNRLPAEGEISFHIHILIVSIYVHMYIIYLMYVFVYYARSTFVHHTFLCVVVYRPYVHISHQLSVVVELLLPFWWIKRVGGDEILDYCPYLFRIRRLPRVHLLVAGRWASGRWA